MSNKYDNAVMYEIINDTDGKIYIGSTLLTLPERFQRHYYLYTMGHCPLHRHMIQIGISHFKINLIEKYPCRNKIEKNMREEYWRERYEKEGKHLLNKNKAYTGMTMKQYQKKYRKEHPNYWKDYRQRMKDNIINACRNEITALLTSKLTDTLLIKS